MISKIHEHDNTNLYKEFKDREGELFTVKFITLDIAIILLDDEGNEIVLPKEKQIPSDFFRKGENVKVLLKVLN